MDWIRILLTVVALYLVFLVFTKFTKWIFKIVIVVLLLGVVIYGNINYSDLIGGEDLIPLIEDNVQINPLVAEDIVLEEEINLSLEEDMILIEENINQLNETIEEEFLNETEIINVLPVEGM
ncbi:MAG: hypothetical protein KKA65_01690 [Nanoarchaeota archaeon]|nr:hypothetical protein [Nanoarchaeota archaeon]MBU4351509.1 hypothetical protein [Nanoarchaeota archaeon]MBU4456189.1 hypothetical protein [Nanoarchaeota archaeon]MCG2719943.1 hypothetical protein [Nanoarchaeota archaeon]